MNKQSLQQIARFVASHDMPMVRVTEGAVEFASEVVQSVAVEGQPDVGAVWCEISAVRSMSEARDAMGY